VLNISARPPVVCADGDMAGLAAGARWAETFIFMGRETLATMLPRQLDPADWLARNGTSGLAAFARPGCLNPRGPAIRPVPAGAIIAQAMCAAAIRSGVHPDLARDALIRRLGRLGSRLNAEEGQDRFAASSARVLAQHDMGPDGWLIRKIRAEMSVTGSDRAESARRATNIPSPRA
jgi:hypothetical protein